MYIDNKNKPKRLQGAQWYTLKPKCRLGEGFLKSNNGHIRADLLLPSGATAVHWLSDEEQQKFETSDEFKNAQEIRKNYFTYGVKNQ